MTDGSICLDSSISIHALLAESDEQAENRAFAASVISIHALLAESDILSYSEVIAEINFYPRSPCGERPRRTYHRDEDQEFLSTLSLRRATRIPQRNKFQNGHFYPRSPCGERLRHCTTYLNCSRFLSTLSLRRATNGYETSPYKAWISIHALLAESDQSNRCTTIPYFNFYPRSPCGERPCTTIITICTALFLSTLSLRRATNPVLAVTSEVSISIHALLAESDVTVLGIQHRVGISIHALLAESDVSPDTSSTQCKLFLSTLSLRRATPRELV